MRTFSLCPPALALLALTACTPELPPPPEAPPEAPQQTAPPALAVPQQPAAPSPTRQPPANPPRATAGDREGEESVEALQARVADLGHQVLELEAKLSQANANTREMNERYVRMVAERDKYEAGVRRCVGELNAQAAAPRGRAPVQQIRPSNVRGASIRALGTPYASQVGDSVNVTGKVWNAGDQAGRATLTVTLLRNGQPVDSTTVYANVPAGGDYSYSHTFRARGAGAYTAQMGIR